MTEIELREEVEQSGERRRGRRFPPELRSRLQRAARLRRQAGESAAQIAHSLDLSAETVRRWCAADPDLPRTVLVPVKVRNQESPEAAIRLVSPRGWRLEGLDLESAWVLLQRLG